MVEQHQDQSDEENDAEINNSDINNFNVILDETEIQMINMIWMNGYKIIFNISISYIWVISPITQAHKKKSGINFTCEYTTPMDFEPLNPNPVLEFPLDPPVFP